MHVANYHLGLFVPYWLIVDDACQFSNWMNKQRTTILRPFDPGALKKERLTGTTNQFSDWVNHNLPGDWKTPGALYSVCVCQPPPDLNVMHRHYSELTQNQIWCNYNQLFSLLAQTESICMSPWSDSSLSHSIQQRTSVCPLFIEMSGSFLICKLTRVNSCDKSPYQTQQQFHVQQQRWNWMQQTIIFDIHCSNALLHV